MSQKSVFLGLFGGSYGVFTSVSWFVLGKATSKGINVYGSQARLVAVGILIMSLYFFWQYWGKFVVKEHFYRFMIISSEILLGSICMSTLCLIDNEYERSLELTVAMSFVAVITDWWVRKVKRSGKGVGPHEKSSDGNRPENKGRNR